MKGERGERPYAAAMPLPRKAIELLYTVYDALFTSHLGSGYAVEEGHYITLLFGTLHSRGGHAV